MLSELDELESGPPTCSILTCFGKRNQQQASLKHLKSPKKSLRRSQKEFMVCKNTSSNNLINCPQKTQTKNIAYHCQQPIYCSKPPPLSSSSSSSLYKKQCMRRQEVKINQVFQSYRSLGKNQISFIDDLRNKSNANSIKFIKNNQYNTNNTHRNKNSGTVGRSNKNYPHTFKVLPSNNLYFVTPNKNNIENRQRQSMKFLSNTPCEQYQNIYLPTDNLKYMRRQFDQSGLGASEDRIIRPHKNSVNSIYAATQCTTLTNTNIFMDHKQSACNQNAFDTVDRLKITEHNKNGGLDKMSDTIYTHNLSRQELDSKIFKSHNCNDRTWHANKVFAEQHKQIKPMQMPEISRILRKSVSQKQLAVSYIEQDSDTESVVYETHQNSGTQKITKLF